MATCAGESLSEVGGNASGQTDFVEEAFNMRRCAWYLARLLASTWNLTDIQTASGIRSIATNLAAMQVRLRPNRPRRIRHVSLAAFIRPTPIPHPLTALLRSHFADC